MGLLLMIIKDEHLGFQLKQMYKYMHLHHLS